MVETRRSEEIALDENNFARTVKTVGAGGTRGRSKKTAAGETLRRFVGRRSGQEQGEHDGVYG